MKYTKILHPKKIKNKRYHLIGAVLIVFNYFRHIIEGYKTPRTFSSNKIEKTVEYDLKVVERWDDYLHQYTGEEAPFANKIVLELGVGPDLGTGTIILAKGAKKYFALDANNLAKLAPVELYEQLSENMRRSSAYDVNRVERQVANYLEGKESNLCYIVDKEFRISSVPEEVDLVVSHAAFEHFDDIERTIKGISNKIKKGGILLIHVDLNTHTRWIKDKDPLNIYRYSDFFWNVFKFRGAPNRERIPAYKKLFEQNKWANIIVEPRTILEEEYVAKIFPTIDRKFRDLDIQEMRVLSFMLIAQKN